MLGPITRHKTGRSRYRMSRPESLVRRFNITPLLRNRQANAPGGLWISIQRNDAPEQSKRLSLADLRTALELSTSKCACEHERGDLLGRLYDRWNYRAFVRVSKSRFFPAPWYALWYRRLCGCATCVQ